MKYYLLAILVSLTISSNALAVCNASCQKCIHNEVTGGSTGHSWSTTRGCIKNMAPPRDSGNAGEEIFASVNGQITLLHSLPAAKSK